MNTNYTNWKLYTKDN